MARIFAVDYGSKRVGFAATDPLKIIASPLDVVSVDKAMDFIAQYLLKEEVELFVMGLPKDLSGKSTDATQGAIKFGEKLRKAYPNIPLKWIDERFTSKIAERAMIDGGMKKKDRQQKGNTDKISAAIILQSYLEQTQ